MESCCNALEPKKKFFMKETAPWLAMLGSYAAETMANYYTKAAPELGSYVQSLPVDIHSVGSVVDYAGLFVALGSLASMAISLSRHKGKGLVKEGMHGVIRHPIYLGFRVSALGMALETPNLETFAAFFGVVLASEIAARWEDDKLKALYGEEFENYREEVPAWVPYSNKILAVAKK